MTEPTLEEMKPKPQCPSCGYTEEDARLQMDHHLCRNAGNAPWEVKTTPQPAPEIEDEAFERWWMANGQAIRSTRKFAQDAWHARARLSAGGK